MILDFSQLLHDFLRWRFWDQFRIVSAMPPSSGSIFGLAEYIASLALFLVVMTTSDFRYGYRLSLTKSNLRRVGFWIAFSVAVAILVTDFWFQNHFPIPKLMSNANNLKAIFATIFLIFVFRVIAAAIIPPALFRKGNAKRFLDANYHYIHQGNADRLQIIAEELRPNIDKIVALAAYRPNPAKKPDSTRALLQAHAHDFLLLIADGRFCRVVVDRAPAFAFACFLEAQKHINEGLPVFQFARNIGREFIRNTGSAFYQEEGGYYSGLVGYAKPATRIIFGSYQFIEQCAADGASPIETDYREFIAFNRTQMEGFARACLAFLESGLTVTQGRSFPHSVAIARMFDSFEHALTGIYKLNNVKTYGEMVEYAKLQIVVGFIRDAIGLVDKHASQPAKLCIPQHVIDYSIYDDLAELISKAIFSASAVAAPEWTSWDVQHNTIWSSLFGIHDSPAHKIIAFKVRRLLYDEIKRMDQFANFKGARMLGYCLHVFGLTLIDRHGYRKEDYALQLMALRWVKANFRRLLSNHPRVAEACLQGSVTYDSENHRLVQTYANEIGKEPVHQFLELD